MPKNGNRPLMRFRGGRLLQWGCDGDIVNRSDCVGQYCQGDAILGLIA